jgi:hypothetical protein
MTLDPAALFAAHQHRLFKYFCRAVGHWRSVESVVRLNTGEVVEIRLPKLATSAGPFSNREFSIRIRARQLR